MLFQYETERLILKILKPNCADLVLDFYNRDLQLFEKYETPRMPDFYTVKYQYNVLRYEYNEAIKMSMVRFYVFRKENPSQIIGTVCLHDITRLSYQSCEIGYKFSSEFHHHGYAFEAIDCCLQIAFDELKLHKVNAFVCDDNLASILLLERVGFKREGLHREHLLLGGKWRNHYSYGILSSDYQISSKHNQ